MARYKDSSCRLCRREGMKLFLKGTKCSTDKCPVGKRTYAPGEHGQARVKLSDYGLQLREKQKVKRVYGILERQFRHYFKIAERAKGVTGEILLQLLERRLDNVLFRLNLAVSRTQARQVVRHGHVKVNDKKVDIPSYLVKKDDKILLEGKPDYLKKVQEIQELVKDRGIPAWIEPAKEGFAGTIKDLPQRGDIKFPIREQLIVELYSK